MEPIQIKSEVKVLVKKEKKEKTQVSLQKSKEGPHNNTGKDI